MVFELDKNAIGIIDEIQGGGGIPIAMQSQERECCVRGTGEVCRGGNWVSGRKWRRVGAAV